MSTGPARRTPREALEAALAENPHDLAAHAAYADLLVEEGDPRGEFIQVQLALEDPSKSSPQRKTLQQLEQKLLREHAREWLGELAPYLLGETGYQYEFRRGWLWDLKVRQGKVAFTRVLARAPQTRLLSRLAVWGAAYEEGEIEPAEDIPEGVTRPALFPLLRSPFLGNVRGLEVGDPAGLERPFNGEAAVGLVKLMPRLEELYLLTHEVDTEELFGLPTLHHLRVLQVDHLTHYPLERLAANPSLTRLTHLLCHPHALLPDDEEPYIRLPGLRAVLRPPRLTGLAHLRLRLTDVGDRGCEELVGSGALKRLKTLDLRSGCISDGGARTLAGSPDLPRLEWLDLSRNCMTEEGIRALRATGVKLRAEDQWDPQDPGGDASPEWLEDGDWE